MAEKEERIYIRGYGEDNPCDSCEDKSGDDCDFCMKNYEWNASISRPEAIKKISSHLLMCDISTMDTDEIAEAALNALLEKE